MSPIGTESDSYVTYSLFSFAVTVLVHPMKLDNQMINTISDLYIGYNLVISKPSYDCQNILFISSLNLHTSTQIIGHNMPVYIYFPSGTCHCLH